MICSWEEVFSKTYLHGLSVEKIIDCVDTENCSKKLFQPLLKSQMFSNQCKLMDTCVRSKIDFAVAACTLDDNLLSTVTEPSVQHFPKIFRFSTQMLHR